MSQTKCYLCFLSSASANKSEKVKQLHKVNNANSAFILINLLISRGCHSGSIGQGGHICDIFFLHEYNSWYSWQIWALSAIYNIFIFVGYISIIFSWYCGQLYVRTGRISNQAGHQQRVFCQPDSQLYEQATQTQLLLLSFLISVVKHCHSILFTYYVRFDLGLGYFGSIQWFLS